MPRPPVDRKLLIGKLGEVFRARGYEGATLAELSRATGLGKASLYHHFPGGKQEILGALVRHAVNDLQKTVFKHLDGKGDASKRVSAMLDGFDAYANRGDDNCLLAVLAQGSAAPALSPGVHTQFDAWLNKLEQVLIDDGYGAKRAARTARHIMSTLYGGIVMSRLLGDSRAYRRVTKRLRKDLAG